MRHFLFLLLAGCTLFDGVVKDSDDVETNTVTDKGVACVNDAGEVEVDFQECLSSSCDTLVSATCTAELVDGVVEVHAEAVIESQGETCTDDCGYVTATCALPLIEDPESVSLSYAGQTTALDAECAGF